MGGAHWGCWAKDWDPSSKKGMNKDGPYLPLSVSSNYTETGEQLAGAVPGSILPLAFSTQLEDLALLDGAHRARVLLRSQ